MKTKKVWIRCPNCEQIVQATIEYMFPWWSYIHTCRCGYIIMESEWNEVKVLKLMKYKTIQDFEKALSKAKSEIEFWDIWGNNMSLVNAISKTKRGQLLKLRKKK